ncbi:hypothetical protein H4R34_000949 [Dimargaris verticillata]|uniref:PhoD-like phosphatase metallophosphatase domain-containing protein n=1 Tax=Dimargaris verticillata TaxID=2761393 RepID=A0A9W8B9F7_9FUNG|nr:hypothetical protein H4R34_000949 [Dimargaris verticillata]
MVSAESAYIGVSLFNLGLTYIFLRVISPTVVLKLIVGNVLVLLGLQLYFYWHHYVVTRALPAVQSRTLTNTRQHEQTAVTKAVAGQRSTSTRSVRQRKGCAQGTGETGKAQQPVETQQISEPPTGDLISPFSQTAFRTPRKRALKALLTLGNILVCTFVFDYALSPLWREERTDLALLRVGALYPDGAKVMARDPVATKVQLWITTLPVTDPDQRAAIYDQILVPGFNFTHLANIPPALRGNQDLSTINQQWRQLDQSLVGSPTHDYTAAVRLTGLSPSTHYAINGVRQFANGTTSELNRVVFQTAPPALGPPLLGLPAKDPQSGHGTKFIFGFGSCIKPKFPYSPMRQSNVPGFANLAQQTMEFLIFLGDFIYADVPYFAGPAKAIYRRLYRQVYHDPDTIRYAQRIPTVHIYDDHEILNNWDQHDAAPMPNALTAFEEYHGSANPDSPDLGTYWRIMPPWVMTPLQGWSQKLQTAGARLIRKPSLLWTPYQLLEGIVVTDSTSPIETVDAAVPSSNSNHIDGNGAGRESSDAEPVAKGNAEPDHKRAFYTFEYGDVTYFVMDTRRYRSPEVMPDGPHKTMLGVEQKQYFHDWLHRVNQTYTFKFVASSVPLTRNWVLGDGSMETWGGYLTERAEVLRWVATVPNVIFLSGDRHEVAVTRLGLPEHVGLYQARTATQTDAKLPAETRDTTDLADANSHGRSSDDQAASNIVQHTLKDTRPLEFSVSPFGQFYMPLINAYQATELDEPIYYRRVGNLKYGTFEIDTLSDPRRPRATFHLYTEEWNGKYPVYNYTVYGQPLGHSA